MNLRRIDRRFAALIAVGAMSVGLNSCGDGGSSTTTSDGVQVVGKSAADRRIASDFYEYLQRGCVKGVKPCDNFERVEANDSVLTVTSDLEPTDENRRIAMEICSVIQGSDVADFSKGHTVNGRDSITLATCPARER
jgi:hypothetical protein